jgi:hypothetical protein
MEHALFMLPIHAGKTAAARAFLRALDQERAAAYASSEERLGITRELWALQTTGQGDHFVVCISSADIGGAFLAFSHSQDAFDQWFKQQVQELTGADLNQPPSGPLSEVLSVYEADR